jgi:hypothetical protein
MKTNTIIEYASEPNRDPTRFPKTACCSKVYDAIGRRFDSQLTARRDERLISIERRVDRLEQGSPTHR